LTKPVWTNRSRATKTSEIAKATAPTTRAHGAPPVAAPIDVTTMNEMTPR
jgi:hypothetical protein